MTTTRAATIFLAAVAIVAASWGAAALSTGGPGGKWPAAWPKELEPLRKQAWTWEHDFSRSYDIPFTDRAQFEASWPHVLTAAAGGRGMSVTLLRRARLRIAGTAGKASGVQIFPAAESVTTGPLSVTRIYLVVDGDVVDLNRIPLPADTPILDERFKDDAAKKQDAEQQQPPAPNPAVPADKNPPAEPRPATPGK